MCYDGRESFCDDMLHKISSSMQIFTGKPELLLSFCDFFEPLKVSVKFQKMNYSSLAVWLVIGMFLCLGDSFWNTLRTAALTKMYHRDSSSQIFALSKFFQVFLLFLFRPTFTSLQLAYKHSLL